MTKKERLPSSDEITKAVATYFNFNVLEMRASRLHPHVRGRAMAMLITRENLHFSYPMLGRAFNRDHTAARALCLKAEQWRSTDLDYKRAYESTVKQLFSPIMETGKNNDSSSAD